MHCCIGCLDKKTPIACTTYNILKLKIMSWQYILALFVNVIGVIVALYFVVSDSINYSTNNGSLSLVTLIFCAWVGTSYYLYHHGHQVIASIMAWIPAVPLIGYGLFVLMFVILKPDMR